MTERGKYIVIEGTDGTGKSTQVERLRSRLETIGIDSVEFHEPGGVPVADEIRHVIKNGSLKRDAFTNVFLFTAARHEIWRQLALPALRMGQWVVAARNYYSTLAYQGYAEGLSLALIEDQTRLATDEVYMTPDCAVVLDLKETGKRRKRIDARGVLKDPDTFESRSELFQQKIREGYLAIAHDKQLPVIEAGQSMEHVTDEIWGYVASLLPSHH